MRQIDDNRVIQSTDKCCSVATLFQWPKVVNDWMKFGESKDLNFEVHLLLLLLLHLLRSLGLISFISSPLLMSPDLVGCKAYLDSNTLSFKLTLLSVKAQR